MRAAGRGSDFWQVTSYGFRRDSGHALLSSPGHDFASEVGSLADSSHLTDQAGVLRRVDEQTGIKLVSSTRTACRT